MDGFFVTSRVNSMITYLVANIMLTSAINLLKYSYTSDTPTQESDMVYKDRCFMIHMLIHRY